MDHRFETPPQKKLAPTPQAINSSPSPYKVNLASIFRYTFEVTNILGLQIALRAWSRCLGKKL